MPWRKDGEKAWGSRETERYIFREAYINRERYIRERHILRTTHREPSTQREKKQTQNTLLPKPPMVFWSVLRSDLRDDAHCRRELDYEVTSTTPAVNQGLAKDRMQYLKAGRRLRRAGGSKMLDVSPDRACDMGRGGIR